MPRFPACLSNMFITLIIGMDMYVNSNCIFDCICTGNNIPNDSYNSLFALCYCIHIRMHHCVVQQLRLRLYILAAVSVNIFVFTSAHCTAYAFTIAFIDL